MQVWGRKESVGKGVVSFRFTTKGFVFKPMRCGGCYKYDFDYAKALRLHLCGAWTERKPYTKGGSFEAACLHSIRAFGL